MQRASTTVPTVSIDTPLIIDWFADIAVVSDAARELLDCHLHWDGYVQQQVRELSIRGAIVAHTNLKQAETVGEAIRACHRFADKGGDASGRIAVSIITTLQDSYLRTGDPAPSRLLLLDDVEDLIEWPIDERFEHAFAMKTDATRCTRALGRPVLRDGFYSFEPEPGCRGDEPSSCGIEEFLEAHTADLKALAACPRKARKIKTLAAACGRALKSPRSARPKACRSTLSDPVIYLTAACTGQIATTNVADFDFLATTCATRVRVLPIGPPTLRNRERP